MWAGLGCLSLTPEGPESLLWGCRNPGPSPSPAQPLSSSATFLFSTHVHSCSMQVPKADTAPPSPKHTAAHTLPRWCPGAHTEGDAARHPAVPSPLPVPWPGRVSLARSPFPQLQDSGIQGCPESTQQACVCPTRDNGPCPCCEAQSHELAGRKAYCMNLQGARPSCPGPLGPGCLPPSC